MVIAKTDTQITQILTPDAKDLITYCHGVEGIINIYQDTLNLPPEEIIYAFLNPEDVHDEVYRWLTQEYIEKRVSKGIFAHVFVTNGHNSPRALKYKELDEKEKRITHFVESYDKPFECEVDIYGDKVAFINYNPKEPLFGIVINHPIIARTLKSFYLHYLWKM